jgi:hypothetical protein
LGAELEQVLEAYSRNNLQFSTFAAEGTLTSTDEYEDIKDCIAHTAECKGMGKEYVQEKQRIKTEISELRAESEKDVKECDAQLHTAQENLEIERALRKDLEDKIADLEKELVKKAEAEESVLTLKTKVCQLEAQVAEYKNRELEHERERHRPLTKISKIIANYEAMHNFTSLRTIKMKIQELEDSLLKEAN